MTPAVLAQLVASNVQLAGELERVYAVLVRVVAIIEQHTPAAGLAVGARRELEDIQRRCVELASQRQALEQELARLLPVSGSVN